MAQVIDQDVVIFGPAIRIGHDPLENLEDRKRLYYEPGFFQDLTLDSIRQLLAGLNDAAGYRPVALQRLPAALHQQNAAVLKNQSSDPYERARRVAARVVVNIARCLSRSDAHDISKSAP